MIATDTLEILHQDNHCVVINKPAGMLVHRSWLDKHETRFAMQTLRDQIGRHVYPVHRLDKPTSGVLLFALDSKSARFFTEQFNPNMQDGSECTKKVSKTYLAVVRGWLGGDNEHCSGQIDYPLSVIRDKIADKHSTTDKPSQVAITDWQVLATTEQPFAARARYPTSRYSLVQLNPHTGRKHQLRRHLKHIFHPIVGDTSYGDHFQNRAIRQQVGVRRLMLHANTLTFANPDGKCVTAVAPVDSDWQKLCTQLGWHTYVDNI